MENTITVVNLCEALHCLPAPGGLLDQDPYWIERFKVVLNARAQQQRIEQERAKKSVKK